VTHLVANPPPTEVQAHLLEEALDGGEQVASSRDGRRLAWAVPHRPWASFALKVSSVPDLGDAVNRLVTLMKEGSDEVVLATGEVVPVSPGLVRSIRRRAERVEIEAESPGDGLLVVNDAHWPGWQARVDGRPSPPTCSCAAFRSQPGTMSWRWPTTQGR